MKIQDNAFKKVFNIFLALIGATIIFRGPCTFLLICFLVFNILYIKPIQLTKHTLILTTIIASPFLLEILFFWNNDSFSKGLKSAEKTVSMLFLPIFILGNIRHVDFRKILFYFGHIIIFLVTCYFIRFIIIYPEHVEKYLNGTDLYESGYFFADTFKSHAPATNMHVCFAAVVNFYFALKFFLEKKSAVKKVIALLLFGLSVFYVLFINTRLAVVLLFAGCILVLVYELLKVANAKRLIKFTIIATLATAGIFYVYIRNNPYMKDKFTTISFENLDKVGKLDEFEHPEYQVYHSIVTRLTIWKTNAELAVRELPFGVGSSDGKQAIRDYYKETNQKFLYKEAFPAHNQLLDMTVRFGIAGALAFLLHFITLGWLALKTRNSIITFFFILFFLSNMVDDFLIRFDGIVFSALWFSIFGAYWLQQKQVTKHTAQEAL